MALSKKQEDPPGALFIFDTWDKNGYGLSAFHRHLVRALGKKRSKSLKLYSTVLDIEIAEKHKRDAEKLGVTLIKARQKKRIDARDDPKRIAWLHNFESYYPGILALKNIIYIIGYSPKTGDAAADIRDDAFPFAQLILINHAKPESDCTLYKENVQDFHERMLKMASEANIIFSIGPKHHRYFENQYRAPRGRNRKKLVNIPHVEILPVPPNSFFKPDVRVEEITGHVQVLLTYGNLNDRHVVQALADIASLVGSVANKCHDFHGPIPGWDILGVSNDSNEVVGTLLEEKITNAFVSPQLFQRLNCESLKTHLCQSHVCLPIRCYNEYSFHGLEALAVGVPLLILEYSHLADFIETHLPEYTEHSIVRTSEEYPTKIIKILKHIEPAFKVAHRQKEKLKRVTSRSYKRFVAILTDYSDGGENEVEDSSSRGNHDKKTSDDHQPMFRDPSEQESQYNDSLNETKHVKQPVDTSTESAHVVHDQSDGGEADESLPENGTSHCDEITVKIKLNKDDFLKVIGRLDREIEQFSTERQGHEGQQQEDYRLSLQERKTEIKIVMEQNNDWFQERVHTTLNGEAAKEFKEFLSTHCKANYAMLLHVSKGCLALHLKFGGLQNLCKFTGRCKSGDFTEPLEPFFITDDMRRAAEKVGRAIHLVAAYDDIKFEAVADFFIIRDGGSDVTDDDTSNSDDNDDDIEQPETPFVVKCFSEATTDIASPQREDGTILPAEREEKICKKNRQSSSQIEPDDVEEKAKESEISVMQTERDEAKNEKIQIECLYKALLEEDKKRGVILSNMQSERSSLKKKMDGHIKDKKCLQIEVNELKDKLKQSETKLNALESEIGEKSQSISLLRAKLSEAGGGNVEEQTKGNDLKTQLGKFRQEKYFVEEGLMKGDIMPKHGSFSGSEIISHQSSEDPVTSMTDEVFGMKPKEELFNSKQARQLVSEDRNVSHSSDTKEDSTDYTSLGDDGSQGGSLNKKYTFSIQEFSSNWKAQPAERPKGKRLAPPGHFRRGRSKKHKDNGSSVEALVTSKDGGLIGVSSILSSRPASKICRQSRTATGSSWSVQILGRWISTREPGNFNSPRGLRWHRNRLVVCDRQNHRVQILDEDNQYEAEIRFDSQFPNQFQPWDVAISDDDKYYITDIGNNQIIVCYQNCEIIQVINLTVKVYGITIMAGFVWVTDCQEYSILKYTLDGTFVAKARLKGHDRVGAIAKYPYCIVSTSSNRLLVSDEHNNIIQVLDSDMNYLDSYCTEGSRDGEVRLPRGLDLDSHGNIYICDWRNHRIAKLRENGDFICNLFEGEIESPNHIAVNESGDRIAITVDRSFFVSDNQIFLFSK